MTDSKKSDSTALVTGASRGFGRAIASALHAQGDQVVAVARNAKLLDSLNAELGGRSPRSWPTSPTRSWREP